MPLVQSLKCNSIDIFSLSCNQEVEGTNCILQKAVSEEDDNDENLYAMNKNLLLDLICLWSKERIKKKKKCFDSTLHLDALAWH